MNTAFVFLKPHAANDATASFAKKHLDANKVTVLKEGVLKAEEILEHGIIDTHYAALAASAVISAPSALPISAEKKQEFQSKYGTSWDEAASKGTLLNLAQFQTQNPGMSVQEIEAKWRSGPTLKLAPGNYVSFLEKEGVCVVNGFYGSMREKFTAPGKEVRWYLVEFDEATVPWKKFRGSVIGATDPTQAEAGSLRRLILEQWKELGLQAEPSTADNGVHASAGPLEGVKERLTWLRGTLDDDSYAKELVKMGVSAEKMQALLDNRDVQLTADGVVGPAFDLTEDMDSSQVAQLVSKMPFK